MNPTGAQTQAYRILESRWRKLNIYLLRTGFKTANHIPLLPAAAGNELRKAVPQYCSLPKIPHSIHMGLLTTDHRFRSSNSLWGLVARLIISSSLGCGMEV